MAFQISTFLISIVIVGALVTSMMLVVADGVNKYDVQNYNSTKLSSFDKLDAINNISQDLQERSNVSSNSGVFDIIGDIFNQGYQSIRLTGASFGAFVSMAGTAGEEYDAGPVGDTIRNAIITIVLIIVFIGIFMAIILKWPV